MAVATFTKSGAKASTPAKLDKKIFGLETANHQLIQEAYTSHLANRRGNFAKTKKRGEVRGGGRKPWRQKGTGNARTGSRRNPLWRGGGITFGPTGNQNYSQKMNIQAKRQALRQALSLAAQEDRIKIIESFTMVDGKAKTAASLLAKIETHGAVLLVLKTIDDLAIRSTRNIPRIKLAKAANLNVFDTVNADVILMSREALDEVTQRLGGSK